MRSSSPRTRTYDISRISVADTDNARIEHDRALLRVMTSMMKDDNQLFKQFMDNDGFKRWMTDTVFELTSDHVETA